MATPVEKHFNYIAARYDYFKSKNWYYYQNLKNLYRSLIPSGKKVLEIGCGTGDLVSSINARYAAGMDISSEMICIAKKKYPKIAFEVGSIENYKSDLEFDYIFLADVIEHLENLDSALGALSSFCGKNTKIIFSFANPLWEPILLILEKLSLKMPEGPHYRIPFSRLRKKLDNAGFNAIDRGRRLLLPAHIPYVSDFINKHFFHIPLLEKIGMLEYIIIQKK